MFIPKGLPLATAGSFPFNSVASRSRKAAPLSSMTRQTVDFEAQLSAPFFAVGSASSFSVELQSSLCSIFALNGPGTEPTQESFQLLFRQAGNFAKNSATTLV
jgi:hypothetical protein